MVMQLLDGSAMRETQVLVHVDIVMLSPQCSHTEAALSLCFLKNCWESLKPCILLPLSATDVEIPCFGSRSLHIPFFRGILSSSEDSEVLRLEANCRWREYLMIIRILLIPA